MTLSRKLVSSLLVLSAIWPSAAISSRAVILEYGALLDRVCSHGRTTEATRRAAREIETNIQRFQEQWDTEGQPLLEAALTAIGIESPFKEIRASLISCGLPSMSAPLLINVRHFIAATDGSFSTDGEGINNLILHELLHRAVVAALERHPQGETPMWSKYEAAPPIVRNHIHVYALEKLVYESAGKGSELRKIKEWEARFPSWRAKEAAFKIVESESAARVVEDLRVQ